MSASMKGLCEWAYSQLKQLYVWGGNGQIATPEIIMEKETDPRNQETVLALYEQRKAEGLSPIRIYDCSGLVSRYLQDHGLVERKRNCDHLADMCDGVFEFKNSADLSAGNLLFRWNEEEKYYHVGIYVGDEEVIESKGRKYGVVKRNIYDPSKQYWTHYGRLSCLTDEILPAKVLTITDPLTAGEDVAALQEALNLLGYPCGSIDGKYGEHTQRAVEAFCNAHYHPVIVPVRGTITLSISGSEYCGDLLFSDDT